MVSGNNYDGFASDVWSMGIIFYVMITGSLPFEDKTTKELYQRIIAGKYAMPEFVSAEAKYAIGQMLVTDPLKRIKLDEIRRLRFFANIKHLEPQIYGLTVGLHPMPIDLELLQEIKKYIPKFDTRKAEQDIRENRHNTVTTTYYLLQKQILREGGKTNVDLQIYLESSP
jgi:serine/threonine protein kinase